MRGDSAEHHLLGSTAHPRRRVLGRQRHRPYLHRRHAQRRLHPRRDQRHLDYAQRKFAEERYPLSPALRPVREALANDQNLTLGTLSRVRLFFTQPLWIPVVRICAPITAAVLLPQIISSCTQAAFA